MAGALVTIGLLVAAGAAEAVFLWRLVSDPGFGISDPNSFFVRSVCMAAIPLVLCIAVAVTSLVGRGSLVAPRATLLFAAAVGPPLAAIASVPNHATPVFLLF